MKKIFKAILAISIIGAMALGFAACGGNGGSNAIAVISREEGSGTRGAFVELTGVEVDKVDKTVATAEISSSTAVVMQTVAGNKAAIGYISLGSLDNTVKAVKVDGVEATADNVKNGTYPICRPFNIATKGDLSDAAKDFIAFIQSDEGQQVITDKGCVSTGLHRCLHLRQSDRHRCRRRLLLRHPGHGKARRGLHGHQQRRDRQGPAVRFLHRHDLRH